MRVHLRQEANAWEVWVSLVDGNPLRMGESFIIGVGATKDAAIADAQKDLNAAKAQLKELRS